MKPSDYARLFLLAAIWGGSFLFMRIVAPVLGALPTAFFRVLLSSLGLVVILAALRQSWDFKNKFGAALALGVINSGVPFLMYGLAASLLPAGYSAIFNATTPLMGVVIGALFFGEAISVRKGLGVAAGLAGVALLAAVGPIAFSAAILLGALACLVATACYGMAGFLTKRWITERGGLDPKLVACGSQLGACLVLMPFFGVSAAFSPPASWGGDMVWLALAALGLICTAWAYIIYFRLIADIGPLRSLTVTFLIPPFGVLWGVLFLGEQISWAHLGGGSLIALALWLVLGQGAQPAAVPGRTPVR
ncbi:DMT family transporter [Pseudoduganella violacea]|uniref:Drug/metabolite transporter (DMT)-like permease n=1 Tax=Pseudoduganella violacea TaxID=1715466 RepID=A0A7W5FW02_9BURK|nr:DMT family transporter [Pseudoduganella violacea]MBB3121535.1 drug/metabolite transporter (DMT)-like permease [Pseudoduganella violacea]